MPLFTITIGDQHSYTFSADDVLSFARLLELVHLELHRCHTLDTLTQRLLDHCELHNVPHSGPPIILPQYPATPASSTTIKES
jgi:hypothetical protein